MQTPPTPNRSTTPRPDLRRTIASTCGSTAFYHAASITKEFGNELEVTAGIRNIFDTRPPQVSTSAARGIPGADRAGGRDLAVRFPRPALFFSITKKF